jgi:hypothetical protein
MELCGLGRGSVRLHNCPYMPAPHNGERHRRNLMWSAYKILKIQSALLNGLERRGRRMGNKLRGSVGIRKSSLRSLFRRNERGKSFFDFALLLLPRGLEAVIASHELSHIELHHRIGLVRTLTNAVPAWFSKSVHSSASG